jgi:hypothetical protein
MIASIVFATFLCTLTPDNKDKCETAYHKSWQGGSQYSKDQADCKEQLKALFPDDVRSNPVTRQYQFAGCYRVLPGEWVGMNKNVYYLQNVDDADDSFTQYKENINVK